MHIHIITVPYEAGRPEVRLGLGPGHFLANGLESFLREAGYSSSREEVRVAFDEADREIATSFALFGQVGERAAAARRRGAFPLLLAGNCGNTNGVLAGMAGSDLGMLWFDGHGDFNTPETTCTGSLDGMALSVAVGRCWTRLVSVIPGFRPLPEAHIAHLGGRDFDAEERAAFAGSGVAVVPADILRRQGVEECVGEAMHRMAAAGVRRVHLHLDLDVLDPVQTPANDMTPPGGLSPAHVAEIIALAGSKFKICSAAVTAFDPRVDLFGRTLQAGIELIGTIVKTANVQQDFDF